MSWHGSEERLLLSQFVLQHPHSPGVLTPQAARCHPASQLSGEEVVSVADVIRSLRATGIWSASPRGVVRPKAAGGHRRGDEGHKHWGGLGPLRDQLSQRIWWVHARLAFFQSLQLPRLLEPSHRHTKTNHANVEFPL